MNQHKQTIIYNHEEINIDIFFLKRKTFAIEIHPDLRVIVKAPLRFSLKSVQEQIILKRDWIAKKLAYFKLTRKHILQLAYTDGAKHLFLGSAYPLELNPNSSLNAIFFVNNTLQVHGKRALTADIVKLALKKWYLLQAEIYFIELLKRQVPPFLAMGYACPSLRIRFMKTRWGSLSAKGMTLNADLIRAPLSCIEYVVMHELCHLKYMHHGKEFYLLLEKFLPEWKVQKQMLQELNTYHSQGEIDE